MQQLLPWLHKVITGHHKSAQVNLTEHGVHKTRSGPGTPHVLGSQGCALQRAGVGCIKTVGC
eukprot:1154328-Pelagomonas_calceolata.AAC.2